MKRGREEERKSEEFRNGKSRKRAEDGIEDEVDEAGEARGDEEEQREEAGEDEAAEKERWKMGRPAQKGQARREGKLLGRKYRQLREPTVRKQIRKSEG